MAMLAIRFETETHMETVADMVVMSRASGLLADFHSGFSRMASYMGGKEMDGKCLRYNQDCDVSWLEEVNKDVAYNPHCVCNGACTNGSSPKLATKQCLSETINNSNECTNCCSRNNCPLSNYY